MDKSIAKHADHDIVLWCWTAGGGYGGDGYGSSGGYGGGGAGGWGQGGGGAYGNGYGSGMHACICVTCVRSVNIFCSVFFKL